MYNKQIKIDFGDSKKKYCQWKKVSGAKNFQNIAVNGGWRSFLVIF